MNPIEIEDQVSSTNDNDEIINPSSPADPEHSSSSSASFDPFNYLTQSGTVRIEEGDKEFDCIKKMFLPGLGPYANDTNIVAIHKTLKSEPSSTRKARWDSFTIFSDAIAKQRGGDANVKFAWYGASREEICKIVSHGFSLRPKPASFVSYGVGICLYNSKLPLYGMEGAGFDRDGVRHMVLCRVILGNPEVVQPGSHQSHPSSDSFDSGVDNLQDPNRYIIWTPSMNSYIFPLYVVSFKASCFMGPMRNPQNLAFQQGPCRKTASKLPSSPWISFPDLLCEISKFLTSAKKDLIGKHYVDFRAKRITREQLVRLLREVIGDKLLIHIIKTQKEKVKFVESPK